MNYKLLIISALALILASCAKDEAIVEQTKLTPVQLTLSLSQTGESVTRTAFHLKDENNPRLLSATWQEDDQITLVIWQDGDDWKADPKLIETSVSLPYSEHGKTSIDLSSLIDDIDLSGFDPAKNIKYAVAKCLDWHSKKGAIQGINTYIPTWETTLTSAYSTQLNDVMLATPVQEVPVPTGGATLVLQGKLEWRCAVLAIKWDIAPEAADILYGNVNCFVLNNPPGSVTKSYPYLYYDPILSEAEQLGDEFRMSGFRLEGKKLGDMAVTPQGYRYFSIPADDSNGVNVTGSQLAVQASNSDNILVLDREPITILDANVQIKAGFCYSINLKVTDTDGDGIPEFSRME